MEKECKEDCFKSSVAKIVLKTLASVLSDEWNAEYSLFY